MISGFLQKLGAANGQFRLWKELQQNHSNGTRVEFRTWASDWDGEAELIYRASGEKARVMLAGYSWGGASAFRFAERLQQRGIDVELVITSDAVYRSWFPSWSVKLARTVLGEPKIYCPTNVQCVIPFRQRVDPIVRGHEIVGHDLATLIGATHWIEEKHTLMDDAPVYQRRVREGVKSFLSGGGY